MTSHLDLVQRSYAAWREHDVAALLRMFTEDCVWELGDMAAATGRERYLGHDGLRELMAEVREIYADWSPRILQARARADGAVLVEFAVDATEPRSGVPLSIASGGQISEFEGERVRRVIQTQFPPPGWDEAEPL